MPELPDPPQADEPEAQTLARAAARGGGVLVGRTIGLQLVTAAATIALARLLTPADFGVFAVAIAVQRLGLGLSQYGLNSALIARPADPTAREQHAVTGFSLFVALLIAGTLMLTAFAIGPALGAESDYLRAVAIASLSLPFFAGRVIPTALLERELAYGRLVLIETADTVFFYVFAVPAAALGAGALSLAGGVPVGALAGMAMATLIVPWARGLSFDLQAIRPLARFGIQVSGSITLSVSRDFGFVALIAALGSSALAGFYAMNQRLLSVPVALQSAIGRVAFPALSKISDPDQRANSAARAAGLTAIVAGLPLTLVTAATAPMLAVVFGERWLPTADLVPFAAPAMLMVICVAAPLQSLALSHRRGSLVLGVTAISAVATLLGAVILVGPYGLEGVGVAFLLGAVAQTAAMLARSPRAARRCLDPALRALVIGAAAAIAGRLATSGDDLHALIVSAAVAAFVWAALTALVMRSELRLAFVLARRGRR
ncbi:hypothetical protein BH10ACT11_BH10ACT11_15100 [soil metagenome]